MSTKILFVCHEASRTGAPKILQQVAEYCASKGDTIFITIANPYSEAFISDLEKIATVIRGWEAADSDYPQDIDVIYSNTITNGEFVSRLPYRGIPVITHVHELSSTIKFYGKRNFDHVQTQTNSYIACSNAVFNHLHNNFAIAGESIETIPSFIDPDEIESKSNQPISELPDLDRILDPQKILIAGAGWATFRKGTDLFIKVAEYLPEKVSGKEIHLLWIGGNADEFRSTIPAHLAHRVHFSGQLVNPLPLLKRADAFLLTSREDPYPLVALESLLLGKPIIGFAGTGGFDDWADEGIATSVPNLDAQSMAAELIVTLNTSLSERTQASKRSSYVKENCSRLVCVEHIRRHIIRVKDSDPKHNEQYNEANTIWNNSDNRHDLGVTAVYYGPSEDFCVRKQYSRSMDSKGRLTIPYRRLIRFDPDIIPGLFSFSHLIVRSVQRDTTLFNSAEHANQQVLRGGGTSVLLQNAPITLLSYGNDPQLTIELPHTDIDDETLEIEYAFSLDTSSKDYSTALTQVFQKKLNRYLATIK